MNKYKIYYRASINKITKDGGVKGDTIEGDFTLENETPYHVILINIKEIINFIRHDVIPKSMGVVREVELLNVVPLSKEVFKLGLDLHGVINDMPNQMKMLTESVIKGGGEVHVITGSNTEKSKSELTELGFEPRVHYTTTTGVGDYLTLKGVESIPGMLDKYGNPLFSDENWDSAKGKYCEEHGISLHLDDTLLYGDYFKTPFARLYTKNK